ncbi:uncharacterized protein LOC143546035 [Bidens hawaiensis]|uniref:uncharacterized protein LOC143546035 n=1 Tax=Bidens hawaiensis TaxID=980011 RepID=UPI00404940F8
MLAKVFIREIVAKHGVHLSIVSDRNTRFTSRFWKKFHVAVGTRLYISTAYHPQTEGQSKRNIQTLEDMLCACRVAYKLELLAELEGIHSTFHISHLRKCLADDTSLVPLEDIEVDVQLNYVEQPMEIVERKEKYLRHKVILLVKVIWKHCKGSNATWKLKTI